MEEYFKHIVEWNFIAVSALLTLVMFLRSDSTFDMRVKRYFYLSSLLIVVLIVCDSIAIYYSASTNDVAVQNIHTMFDVVCYAIKPAIVMFLLFIVVRKDRQIKVIYFIPEVINIIAALSALIGPWVFSYRVNNIYQRGPFGYTVHIVALIYTILIVNELLKSFKDKNYYEGVTVIWILIILILATIIDSEADTKLLNSVLPTCLAFYYFYFYFHLSKRDIMTDTFNRNVFFEDMKRFESQITALMLFNMSDLNVRDGRENVNVWDESLMSMVRIVSENVSSSARIYRIGGDEISVIFLNEQKENIRFVFENIKKKMKNSDYLFASGLAFNDRKKGTDELMSRVNDAMRIDKSNIRAGRIFRQRQLAAETILNSAESEFTEQEMLKEGPLC